MLQKEIFSFRSINPSLMEIVEINLLSVFLNGKTYCEKYLIFYHIFNKNK